METEIKLFISYLHNPKRMSGNTVVSYERDLKKMMLYFQEVHQMHPGAGYHRNQPEFLHAVSGEKSFRSIYGIEKRGFPCVRFSSICIRNIS